MTIKKHHVLFATVALFVALLNGTASSTGTDPVTTAQTTAQTTGGNDTESCKDNKADCDHPTDVQLISDACAFGGGSYCCIEKIYKYHCPTDTDLTLWHIVNHYYTSTVTSSCVYQFDILGFPHAICVDVNNVPVTIVPGTG